MCNVHVVHNIEFIVALNIKENELAGVSMKKNNDIIL